jgi:hypothetical protein
MRGLTHRRMENGSGSGGAAGPGSGRGLDAGASEHLVFLGQFSDLSRRIIRPVMEHVMELIKKMGFDSGISERKEMALPDGRVRNAEIRLTIVPPGCKAESADPEGCPSVVFFVPPFTNIIRVQVSRKLPGGGWRPEDIGEFLPQRLTENEVSGQILRVLELATGDA